jgi:hypothetical protein
MADQIVRTGNLWLAAFWMAHGLFFLEANCTEDSNPGHVIFSFSVDGLRAEIDSGIFQR